MESKQVPVQKPKIKKESCLRPILWIFRCRDVISDSSSLYYIIFGRERCVGSLWSIYVDNKDENM